MDDIFNSLEKRRQCKYLFQLKGVIQSNFSQNGFLGAVEQVKKLIEDGHTTNSSFTKILCPFKGDPFWLIVVLDR